MYDALTSRYGFSCPVRGETSVTLSAFRSLEALAGTSHPVVYRVTFACGCGGEHASVELSDLAARRIQAGEWPWTFFCLPEERPRPVFPSAFFLLAASDDAV